MISSVSPTDGRVLAEYEETSADDVVRHIDNAARLQLVWGDVPISSRAVAMLKMADLLEASRQELGELMADEMGKPIAQGPAEVDKCAWVCRHYAENAERILSEERYVDDRLSFLDDPLDGSVSHESGGRAHHEVRVADRLGHVTGLGEVCDRTLRPELGHALGPHRIEVDPEDRKLVFGSEVAHDRASYAATAQYHDFQDDSPRLMSSQRAQIRPDCTTFARA